MKILVTGGTGFIGAHLVDKLIELGHDVIVISNKEPKRKNKKTKYAKGDITKKGDVEKAMIGCSVVFHLASLIDARSSDQKEMQRVNILGSKNVFSPATKNKCKIIFTSSAAVYGDSKTKEDSRCKPISDYGKSKMEAEKLLGKDAFIVRLFNVYGPGGKGAVNIFCENIMENKPVNIYGNGLQTRDFVYVSDVVDALILGMKSNGIYNVGSGTEITVKELIEKIEKISRKKAKINYLPANKQEIRKSKADISKIKNLGWKPKVSLEEGIRNIIEN